MQFDFAQNTTVDNIEKVPADFRGLYAEHTEGDKKTFKLASDNPAVKSAVAAITGLNSALKAARAEAAAAKGQQIDLTPLSEFGTDPAAIATKVKETIEGLQGQLKGVDVNKIKADLEKPWSQKVTAAEERAKKAEASFHQRVVVGDAKSAIASAKADELLLPFVLQSAKVVTKENGELDVVIVDDQGAVRYSGVTGQPMTIAERVQEMKGIEKFAKLFPSEAPAGGGAAPGSTSRNPPQTRPGVVKTEDMSPQQKIAAGLSKGLAAKAKR